MQSIELQDTAVSNLIERAQNFDKEAFSMIYDMYYDNIYRYAFFKVGKQEEAEDIAQNTFIGALKNITSYKPGKGSNDFAAWLFTIARNQIVNFYRKNGRQRTGPIDDLHIIDPLKDTQKIIEGNGDLESVYKALKEIPDTHQQVLIHRFINEFSIKETAAAMKKTEGAVKTLQVRAIDSLKKIMDRENGR